MKEIRDNIILEEGFTYMDFTASGLGYKPIEDKILNILKTYANTHSEVGHNASLTTKYYEKARNSLRESLELDDSFYIMPTGNGATGAIKKFQELMGLYMPPVTRKRYDINPKNLPLVVIGPFEHHSNEISYREGLCDVIRCPLDEDGFTDLLELESILQSNSDREIIGSFSSVSNVTGVKNPIGKIYSIIKKYNGTMCIDVASSSAYMNIDCNNFDVMFLSPHKLVGGPGSCGLLVIKKELCNKSEKPTFSGGGVVDYVSRTKQTYYKDIEVIEDAGTPGILQFIRASLAYELRNEIGLDFIKEKEENLKNYFLERIKEIKGLDLYYSNNKSRIPIFSFNIDGFTPGFLADKLSSEYNIQTRSGCSCAGPYGHDLLGIKDGDVDLNNKPGWLRVGLHYTHEIEDVDYFIKSLKKVIKN